MKINLVCSLDLLLFLTFWSSPNAILLYSHEEALLYHNQQEQEQQNGLKINYYQINLHQVIGPESIAFDCHGRGPYIGVSDGRILRWQGPDIGWKEFAVSSPDRERKLCDGTTNPSLENKCGRPLGLKFNPVTCDLYIADAYFGLQVVGPGGGVAEQLVVSAEGIPFRFTNALDIDTETGAVYFTDSSSVFRRREYLLIIISGDRTGRLLKYDPRSKEVTVLYKGLAFPNGVALSKDNSFILVAESTTQKILRFSLNTAAPPVAEEFALLERFPDNIKRNDEGDFWVALNAARGEIRKTMSTMSIPLLSGKDPVAVKYDEEGNVMAVLDGNGGETLDSVSEVEEREGGLYVGSAVKPYVGIIKTPY